MIAEFLDLTLLGFSVKTLVSINRLNIVEQSPQNGLTIDFSLSFRVKGTINLNKIPFDDPADAFFFGMLKEIFGSKITNLTLDYETIHPVKLFSVYSKSGTEEFDKQLLFYFGDYSDISTAYYALDTTLI
jgi:hypothetical protein